VDLGENQAMETTIDKIRYSFEKAVHTKSLKIFRRVDILVVNSDFLLFQMSKLLEGRVLRYSLQGTENQTWEILLLTVWLIG